MVERFCIVGGIPRSILLAHNALTLSLRERTLNARKWIGPGPKRNPNQVSHIAVAHRSFLRSITRLRSITLLCAERRNKEPTQCIG
jgi:hypothetical protein